MLMQFPRAHDDELLGSVIARFAQRQGLEDDKVVLDQLFGSRHIVPSTVLQGHANQLLAHIGHLWDISPRALIENHTLLPIFRPFVAAKAYDRFARDLFGQSKNHSVLRTGLAASNIVWPSSFKVCPLCSKRQLRGLGYLYWQRLFQCPGVEVCPEHGCVLLDTGIPLQSQRRNRFVGTQTVTQNIPALSDLGERKDWLLSSLIAELLQSQPTEAPNSYQWSRFYRALAKQQNLSKGKGVKHDDIAAQVREYWGGDWLERWGLSLSACDNWLVSMFRKHRRAFSYLQHFACWCALYDHEPLLTSVLTKATEFSRQPDRRAVYFSPRADTVCHEYRASWIKLMSRYGSLREIRQQRDGVRVYSWLYRFDARWLSFHKPREIKRKAREKIDWMERDRMILRELFAAARPVWQHLDGPRRSKTWYCRQVPSGKVLEKKLSKLPLCAAFFVRYAETIEEYQVRRLACIFARLLRTNKWLTPIHEIKRIAGLDNRKCREAGRQILEEAIPTWQFLENVPVRKKAPVS